MTATPQNRKKTSSIASALLVAATLFFSPTASVAKCPTGGNKLMEVVGSACWECMFPITISGIPVVSGPMQNQPMVSGARQPMCVCPMPPPIFKRIGLPVGFFEASRLAETVSESYCFPMFGFQISNPSGGTLDGSVASKKITQEKAGKTFMQVHWYEFPIYAILEMMTDSMCLEQAGFDMAYITEVDPLWQDDMMTAIINPEALLFGNPIANLACMADSVSAFMGHALDPLFWCKGSWGNAYPLGGNTHTKNIPEDAASITASFIYKLHRELVLWNAFGPGIMLCMKTPAPIWQKNAYRMQLVYPVPHPLGVVIGQHGIIWTVGKNPPFLGDNFGFLVFKKRECCAS